MNNTNNKKIAKASVVFYVIAVIFLFIAAYLFYMTYETVVVYKQSYTTTMKDIIGLYLTNVSPYFAYAFILYGIGVILKKFSVMTDTIAMCMDSAVEEEEDEDNSVFFDEDEDDEEDDLVEESSEASKASEATKDTHKQEA